MSRTMGAWWHASINWPDDRTAREEFALRICHVITGLNQGGAEQAMFRLLGQATRPEDVLVVSLTGDGVFRQRLQAIGIHVELLQLGSWSAALRDFLKLVRLLRKWKPDVVQTWMWRADFFGGLAAVAARVPVCWGIRAANLSKVANKRSTLAVVWLCAWMSRFVPAVAVSCSARAMELHRRYGYRCRFVVVPNGLDAASWRRDPAVRVRMRAALGLDAGQFVFAHASRADPLKDHATLARSFSQVVEQVPKGATLLLCGAGLEVGDSYLENLPFTPLARVSVKPLGPRDDLADIWSAADGFVLSSIGEGFPNAVVEAMASGLPCVVTDVGDSAEIVEGTGFVVAPSDPPALAGGMVALSGMTDEARQRLGEAARQRVAEHFTLGRMADGFRRVWTDVIAKGQR